MTAPTCKEGGYTTYTCACGVSYVSNEVETLAHTEVTDEPKAPTCTEPGLTEGKHCSVCGEVLLAQTEVPALGHTEVIDEAVAATHETTGLTEGKHCSVCGDVLVAQTEVPALGHTAEVVAAVAATCTKTGLTEGSKCSVCGEVLLAQTEVPALGHTAEVVAAVAATCTKTGLTEGSKCSVCGEVLLAQTEVPALGHTAGDPVVENEVAATCTAAGSYDNVVKCSVCTEELSREAITVDAAGHTYVDSACSVCGASETVSDPEGETDDTNKGVLMMSPAPAATSVTIENVVYEIIDGTGNAQVTDGKSASGNVVIPEKVTIGGGEYTVTTIASNAFNDANEVTSIVVPNSVTTLGGAAFANMDNLESITIGNGVTSWGEKLAVNNYELETVVIEEGATLIGDTAFRTCPKLANVTLPSTLKSIGATAFAYAAITELDIPASVQTIGADAFKDIDTLEKVTFNSVPSSLGTTVFQMCDGLEEVVLPEGLTSIPQGTFRYCTALKTINFPESLTEIGNYSFQGCTSLESVTISKDITNLVTNAFNGCTSLKNLTIEEGFAGTIGGYVFQGCTALESVVIPSTMETVGESMFNGCTSLKSVTLSEGVKTLNISAFENCTSLETLTLPDSLERMRHGSIANCTSLKTLTITGDNLPVIEYSNALDGLSDDLVVIYNGSDEFTGNWAALADNVVSQIDLSQGSYTIERAGKFVVLLYKGANTLTIKSDATIVLNGVNITAAEGASAISIESGNVTLRVEVDSTLTGGKGGAGIYVAEDASVTITGAGKLTAIGNGGKDTPDSGAAGIGGTYANGNSGAITIDGATVVAKGYGVHGSGIGSGSGKVVGEIRIVNGADVTAIGGYYADGAGAKLQSSYGKTDPEGGAAIGGGGKTTSTIANITIKDSTVKAYGGSKAAGIGANFWSSCGTITITGNDTVVTAQGGSSSAAIGTSRAGDSGVYANIVIEGGKVKATGGAYGAGIGGGYNADSLGNGADASALPEISITISGATTEVTANGGEGGAGIGGGYKTDNVDIDITDGTVTAAAGAFVSGKTIDNGGEACAIGSGANGSGKFENSPAVEIYADATVNVTTEYGGKPAIEGMTDEAANALDKVTVVVLNAPIPPITGTITENTVWEDGDVVGPITIADDVTITVKGTVTVAGTIKLTKDAVCDVTFNGENSAKLIRSKDFTGQMFYAEGVSGNFQNLEFNDITLDGGAVWTGDVDKTLNRGTTNSGVKATGSVLYLVYANADLNHSVLQNHDDSTGEKANAVFLRYYSTIDFNNSKVRNNNSISTYYRGGVVTVRQGGTVTTDHAEVYGNSGAAGGFFGISSTGSFGGVAKAKDSKFHNNYADNGAVFLMQCNSKIGYLEIDGCEFYENASNRAVLYEHAYSRPFIIRDSYFHDNECAVWDCHADPVLDISGKIVVEEDPDYTGYLFETPLALGGELTEGSSIAISEASIVKLNGWIVSDTKGYKVTESDLNKFDLPEGYTFLKMDKDKTGDGINDYAAVLESDLLVDVTVYDNFPGSAASESQSLPSNVKCLPALNFAHEGFAFAGWMTASDGTEVIEAKEFTENINLYAKWTPEAPVVTLSSADADDPYCNTLLATITNRNDNVDYTYQWYMNDVAIEDATSEEYTIAADGTYKCVVTAYVEGLASVTGSASGSATYKVRPIAQVGENTYGTLAEAVAAANAIEGGATITLLYNVTVSEKLTIKNNITISGEHTITRGIAGTIFAVDKNATLTLDGGVIIDGGNDWTFDSENFYADMAAGKTLSTGAKDSYSTSAEGGLASNAPLITISGTNGAVVMNRATIQNIWADNHNNGCLFSVPAGATLTINEGALISHIRASVAGQLRGEWTMYGGKITGVHGHNTNGGMVDLRDNGKFTINGGEICYVTTLGLNANGNGILAQVYGNSSKLTINDGNIHDNASFSPGGGWGSVVYLNRGGDFEMNGGTIKTTASDHCTAFVSNTSTSIVLNNGTIVVDESKAARFDSLIYGNVTVGEGMKIEGEGLAVLLGDAGNTFENNGTIDCDVQICYAEVTGNGTYNGDVTVKADDYFEFNGNVVISGGTWKGTFTVEEGASLSITGGTFTQDVSEWLADGYKVELLADGTYKVVEDPLYGKVARIGEGENAKMFETLQAAIDACMAGDNTITLLDNVTVSEMLTITGDVTIEGAFTITRDDAYTGTLFAVNAGATLTLDGGLVIDGNNKWTLNEELYNKALNLEASGVAWADLITSEEGKPNAIAPMFKVTGAVVAKNVTIQNNYSNKSSNNGDYGVFQVDANATLTMTGATVKHIVTGGANSVAHLSTNSVWTINDGTLITDTFAGKNGGVCRNDSGKLVMNGGEVSNNKSLNTNGTFVMLYKGSMEMNGGKICSNSGISGTSNGRCAPIYGHSTSTYIMTGGEICHNTGISYGGLDLPSSIKAEISGGYVGENVSSLGNINKDVNGNLNTVISGGTFTQDVTSYLAPDWGLEYNEETGEYSVTDHVYNLYFRDPATGEQLSYVGPLQGNDPASLVATGKLFYADYYKMELEVLHDAKIDDPIVIDYPMTINLNGKTLTGVNVYPMVCVQGGAEVTVKDGSMVNDDYVFVLGASDGTSAGVLTIESGKYHGDITVASVTKGTLTITGGEFSADPYEDNYDFTLNCIDANYKDGSAVISVTGGTFHQFDPANNAAEGVNTSFVADGYISEELTEGTYTVRKANYVAQVGENKYESIQDAVAAANAIEGGATVTLLKDVPVSEKLTITGDVTIEGEYTITRAVDYTGTLFAVNAGATLTMDGGLVIDGGNKWTYTKGTPELDMANGAGTYVADHITPAEGGVNATASLIANNGTLNVNKATVQNSYSTNGVSAIDCGASSVTTLNGATIQKIAANRSGAVVYVGGADAVLTIKGDTRITDNFGIGNGGIIQNYGLGTTVNLEGGQIDNNHVGKSGTLYASYSSKANKINTFNMSGGIITENVMEGYGPVYIHTNTVWNMTGGEISNNISFLPNYVRSNGNAATISGGKIVDNEIKGTEYSNGYYVTRSDIYLGSNSEISGGTFTQNVTSYLAPDCGLEYNPETGEYTVTDHVYNLYFRDPTTGEQLSYVGPLQGNDPASLVATGKLFYADYYKMELEVLHDAKIDDPIVIDYPMTINLNGKTITGAKKDGEQVYPMIRVQGGADVTVKGGSMVNDDYVFVLGASDSSSAGMLTIESGKYHGDTTVASVTKGTLTITGGEFSADPYEDSYDFTLNCIDANYKNDSAKIEVKGGTFYKFNPAKNAAEGADTSFVADGYLSEQDGDYYTVRLDKDSLATVVTISFTDSNTNETVTLKYPSERYDSIQKLIGTNDYADFVLGAEQSELLAYVADGRASDIVMTLHDDVELDAPINFYNKYFQVDAKYDITLDGNGHTITWADGYTGTLFNVEKGVSLTTENLTIDGENAFTFYNDTTSVENGQNWYTRFVNVGEEDKAVNANVIENAGDLKLDNTTIKNVTIASDAAAGKTENTATGGYVLMYNDDLAVIKSNGGSVTMSGAKITGNAGLILNAVNATSSINATIDRNMGAGNKGGIVIISGGKASIAGSISDNKAMARSATVLGVINGAEVTSTATIENNKHLGVGSNTAGAMIVLEGASQFVMNGGSISNNVGGRAGAIASRWVGGNYGQHEDTSIVLNSGTITGNTASNDSWDDASVFLRSPATIGEGMTIDGVIAVNAAPGELAITGGNITNGDGMTAGLIVTDGLTAEITGGTFNYDPSEWCAEGYMPIDNGDNSYTVKKVGVISSVEDLIAFRDAVTGNTEYQGLKVAANPDVVVTLTADLDLANSDFTPIGNGAANAFSGTFDGQGHTISNMTLSCDYYRGVGFFRSLGKGAVIKNLTFENANIDNGAANGGNHFYGVVAGFSNNLTLDNVDVMDSSVTCKYAGAIMVGCLEGATEIKNCDLENNTLKTTSIRAAVYGILGNSANGHTATLENNTITNVGSIVDGEVKAIKETLKYGEWNTGTEYIESTYVAQIGETNYSTLFDAVAAANAGDIITLIDNVVRAESLVVNEDVTIDLAGHTISNSNYGVFNPMFRIVDGANVTVKGGTMTNEGYVFILGASDGSSEGNLTIESGTYTGVTSVASVTKGTLTIEGGEFKTAESSYGAKYLLNCIDANYKDDSAKIVVKGGRFYGFNPENNAAEGANTNFVPMGYRASIYGTIDGVDVYDVVVLKATVEAGGITYYYPGVENVDSVQELTNYYFLMQNAMGWILGYDYEPVLTIYADVEEETILGNTPSDDTTVTLPKQVTWTVVSNSFDVSNIKAADGYVKEDNKDGTYTIKENYIQWIKAQLLAGNDVTLDRDIVVDGSMIESIPAPTNGNGKYPNYGIFNVVGDEVTFDLNGHTITYNGHADFQWNGKTYNSCTVAHGLFYANAGAHLTVKDSGTTGTVMVYGLASGAYVASPDTTFTIEGGTWKNEGCNECGGTNIFLYPLQGGELYIKGGHFEQALDAEDESYLIVEHGGAYANSVIDYSKTKVEITGGTFVGMNPEEIKYFKQTADNKLVMGETTNGCNEKFAAAENSDGSYTVKPLITVTFDNATMVLGNEVPKFTYTTNFTEVSEDGEMLVVNEPEVTVNGAGKYKITAEAYVFMSDKYVVRVTPGTLTVVEAIAQIGETQYESLQAAIDAAKTGDTIVLLKDLNLAEVELEVLDGSYDTYFLVEGKSVTIDLNDKTISGEYTGSMLIGVFSTDKNGHLTLTGNGTVDVTATNKVYSLLVSFNTGSSMTIENGTYKLDKASDSLIYYGGDKDSIEGVEGIVVKGGTFELGNVGTGENGKPWIFNVLGAGDHHILITGGTFNADINHQHWSNEAVVAKECYVTEEDGKWTVNSGAVAYVGEGMLTGPYFVRKDVGYPTLKEAVDEAIAWDDNPVTLLKDNAENVEVSKPITLDVNYKSYTGTVTLTALDATLTAVEGLNVVTDVTGHEVVYEQGVYKVVECEPVAQIGEGEAAQKFTTLAAAIDAAKDGDTIYLLADITEDVTINESVSINGDADGEGEGKPVTYTGKITVSGNVDVAIWNVAFDKGYIAHESSNVSGNLTVKGCTFANGGYAVTTSRINSVTIEGCTVTNQSLLYAKLSTLNISVKDVEISGGNYVAHIVYGDTATFENVTATDMTGYGIYTQNYGAKTITLKNCSFDTPKYNSLAVKDDRTSASDTFVFEGENKMSSLSTSEYAKYVLAAGATLAAPDGHNVTTNVDGYKVVYENGVYKTVPCVAAIGETQYESLQAAVEAAKTGETVVLLTDIKLGWDDTVKTADGKAVLVNVEGKNITLNLNDKKITVEHQATEAADRIYAVVLVADGASLTVTGEGTIDVTANATTPRVGYMFWKRGTTGNLTVENGTYHMNHAEDSMVYTNGDKIVTIEGGKWTLDAVNTEGPWIFNVQGAGDHSIIITGGSYNADINRQKWSNEAVVAKECYVTEENGYWTVNSGAVAYVNEGMLTGPYYAPKDVGYPTLAEAIAAAIEKVDYERPVTLLKDNAEDVEVSGTIILDLGKDEAGNAYSYTGTVTLTALDATLTAVEDLNVTTNVEGCEAVWEDGIWTVEELTIEFATFSVALDSQVYLRMIFNVPEEVLNMEGAYAVVTKEANRVKPNGQETTYVLSEMKPDSKGRYYFDQEIASGEMTGDVTVKFFDGNDKPIYIKEKNGEIVTSATRTVVDYAKAMIGNPRVQELMIALLTYGGYAQVNFRVDTDNLAYDVLTKLGYSKMDISTVTADTIKQELTTSDSDIGIVYKSQQVNVDASVYMRNYFILSDGASIDNYKFVLTYPEGGADKTKTLEPMLKDGRYYVDITDIAAAYWDYMYKITVTNNETGETYEMNTSVLAWGKRILNSSTAEKTKDLVKAMYLYNQEANDYFKK